MTRNPATERVNVLRRRLDVATVAYIDGSPQISDRDYDVLYAELAAIEARNPEAVSESSPTQRVGYPEHGASVQHTPPMLSIDNTYDLAGLASWDADYRAWLHIDAIEYVCELKIDGVSIAATYEAGKLVSVSTRGDGWTGRDITDIALRAVGIPHTISATKRVEARGEIYMTWDEVARQNALRAGDGRKALANPRAATAAVVTHGKPGATCAAFYHAPGPQSLTQAIRLQVMADLGFAVDRHSEVVSGIDAAIAYAREWGLHRSELAYPADGVVIKVNEEQLQERIGYSAHAPRFMMAYKWGSGQ
jgi:DNA ligase (NAD+)